MRVTQSPSEHSPSDTAQCSHCKALLPAHAAFCGTCGTRVSHKRSKQGLQEQADIAELYRVTSLIRRRHHVQLFLALDIHQQRPVILRDIDLSGLNAEQRSQALSFAQREYDLLRREAIPDVLPLVNLHISQGHLFTVAGWPFPVAQHALHARMLQRYILQDLLQSGIGLPDEEVALRWTYRLCVAAHQLHRQQIALGELDPYTIIVSTNDYTGNPALMLSWLPRGIHTLFGSTSTIINSKHFSDTLPALEKGEIQADIYSLGAILFLLLTGSAPEEFPRRASHSARSARSLRELNPHVSTRVEEVVLRALSFEGAAPFTHVDALAQALLKLCSNASSVSPLRPSSQTQQETHHSLLDSATQHSAGSIPSNAADVGIAVAPLQAQPAHWHVSPLLTSKQEVEGKLGSKATMKEQLLDEHGNGTPTSEPLPETHTPPLMTDQGLSTMPPQPPVEEETAEQTQRLSPPERSVRQRIYTSTVDTQTLTYDEHATLTPTHEYQDEHLPTEDAQDELQNGGMPSPTLPTAPSAEPIKEHQEHLPTEDSQDEHQNNYAPSSIESEATDATTSAELSRPRFLPARIPSGGMAVQGLKQRLSGLLPALPFGTSKALQRSLAPIEPDQASSIIQQLQNFLLGVQHRDTTAAALIETPLRVQPNQSYSVRIQLMGREEPMPPKGAPLAGLSAMVEGEVVHIEVRSTIYQNYAYIVQRADVEIPKRGYAAEVLIPLRPLFYGPGGRRERLYIFFTDRARQPLYEKPFVVEVFVSPLVQSGREGHNVLTIPL